MTLNQAVSSCRAVFDYTVGSQAFYISLFFLFVVLPVLKVVASVIKTTKKIKSLEANCSPELPTKLQDIIKKHSFDPTLFSVSCENNYVAVSFGLVSRKIFFSRYLIGTLTKKELEAIVLHEVHHTRFYHSLVLFMAEVFTSTFFFLPFFKDILLFIKAEFEKSADMAAVEYQKTTKYVKKSLEKVILAENHFGIFPQFSYQIIDQRLDNLNYKKSIVKFSYKRLISSIVVLVLFSTVFVLNTKYAMAASMEEKITCSLFDCVQDCVATEIFTKKLPMSEVNFSAERL